MLLTTNQQFEIAIFAEHTDWYGGWRWWYDGGQISSLQLEARGRRRWWWYGMERGRWRQRVLVAAQLTAAAVSTAAARVGGNGGARGGRR